MIKFCCEKWHCILEYKYILSSVYLLFILTYNLYFCPRGAWGLVLHTNFQMLIINVDEDKNRSYTGYAACPGLSKISCLSMMSEKSRMMGEIIIEFICKLSLPLCFLLLYRW
jgi:hypothetical protein